jgi:hypothetical protein
MKGLRLQQTTAAMTQEIMTEEGQAILSRGELRQMFEKHFEGKLDFKASPETHHVYADPKTESVYLAFKMTVRESRLAIRRNLKKGPTKAPYIVGTMVGDGTIQFGYRPVRHSNPSKALAEAQRLHENYGKNYVVLGTIHKVHGDMVKPEESKQGVTGGRLDRAKITRVTMERLRKFLDENPAFAHRPDTPITVAMRPTGMFIQFAEIEDKPVRNFNEAIVYIHNWLDEAEKWEALRESLQNDLVLTHKTMVVELPQRSPPTVLKNTTDGIYPLVPESVKADKPAE